LTDLKVFRAIGGYKPFVVFSVACVILMTVSYSLAYFLF
jgi:hypothetical protein